MVEADPAAGPPAGRHNVVLPGTYHDSITLLRLSRDLEAVPGVRRAAVMMGTPANRALLEGAGLLTAEGAAAGPGDLVVAVAADDEAAVEAAVATARRLLAPGPPSGAGAGPAPPGRPRTLAAALRRLPGASLALISVPGAWAGDEARRALEAGLDVMLFSDNVPVETEVRLKRLAGERGRLLMGPDCGTAIVAGVPLGFANAVPRGRIGIAAAAGTGLQAVACHVAAAGEGVSHALGVGGRDLGDAVGGLGMERALGLLAGDAATAVVCVVGKPPGPRTRRALERWLAGLGKPWVAHFVGEGTGSLEDCAGAAVALARGERFEPRPWTLPPAEVERLTGEARRGLAPGQRLVRGVFSGGTLAWEARGLLEAALGAVAPGVTGDGAGHRIVDLGEDRFTAGRPHPMIDGGLRRQWIVREAADPETAVLLLDVVLGHGAHPDPAGDLRPAIEAARAAARAHGRGLAVVASVVGTDADPQGRSGQVAALRAAGAVVMPSSAQAARLAARVVGGHAG